MDYSVMIITTLAVAGVGGFLVLAFTLLNNWRAGSRGHEETRCSTEQTDARV